MPTPNTMNTDKLNTLKRRLANWIKGWTAHALLQQSLDGKGTVTIQEYPLIVQNVMRNKAALKQTATIKDVINAIIDHANSNPEIAWTDQGTKDLAITWNGEIFHVEISKREQANQKITYKIDITGQVHDGDMLKFHPPAPTYTEPTTIDFTAENEYTITPASDMPMIESRQMPPRALQLNVVSSFAKALDTDASQLALLGTGTGKSFIIANAAEAAGGSVIVLPSADLASEMLTDTLTRKMFSGKLAPEVIHINELETVKMYRDSAQTFPQFAVLLSDISNEDVLRAVLQREDIHLICNADHPNFAEYIKLVQNKLLLIDEGHQHAYTAASAQALEAVCSQNATLALTGTPTSHLLQTFGNICAEFNLGKAIEAHILRGVQGSDMRMEEQKLLEQAIVSYFQPIYLQSGDTGFKRANGPSPTIADIQANALPPAQKGMIFADDKAMLAQIRQVLTDIQNGTIEPAALERYQEAVRVARISGLREQLQQHQTTVNEAELEAAVPPVRLRDELDSSRRMAVKNTILSFALSVLMSTDREKFAAMLRTNSLSKVNPSSANFTPLTPTGGAAATGKQTPSDKRLEQLSTKLQALPPAERNFLIASITETAHKIEQVIKALPPTESLAHSTINAALAEISTALDPHLDVFFANNSSIDAVDMRTSQQDINMSLDKLKYGFTNIALSDEKWATGISIGDVLTTVIVNNYFEFDEPNAVCGPLGGAQAAGRVVRDDYMRGSVVMLSNENIPEGLILSVKQILALDSGEQSASVLELGAMAKAVYDIELKKAIGAELKSAELVSSNRLPELKSQARDQAYKVATELSAILAAYALPADAPQEAKKAARIEAFTQARQRLVEMYPATSSDTFDDTDSVQAEDMPDPYDALFEDMKEADLLIAEPKHSPGTVVTGANEAPTLRSPRQTMIRTNSSSTCAESKDPKRANKPQSDEALPTNPDAMMDTKDRLMKMKEAENKGTSTLEQKGPT